MSAASENPILKIRLVLKSAFTELERALEETETFFLDRVGDEELLYKIMLLVSEAVSNAMEHGNRLDSSKSVIVDLEETSDSFEIWVEDEGEGYDRDTIANPLSAEHLLDDGGRGVFLIEQMADEVRFDKDGRRVGILFKK